MGQCRTRPSEWPAGGRPRLGQPGPAAPSSGRHQAPGTGHCVARGPWVASLAPGQPGLGATRRVRPSEAASPMGRRQCFWERGGGLERQGQCLYVDSHWTGFADWTSKGFSPWRGALFPWVPGGQHTIGGSRLRGGGDRGVSRSADSRTSLPASPLRLSVLRPGDSECWDESDSRTHALCPSTAALTF